MNPAMGSCREFEGNLAASLYGDLKPAEQAALDTHLAGCAGCRAEQAELRRTVDLLRPVSIKLSAHERGIVRPKSRLWIGAAAAAAAAIFTGVLLWPSAPPPRPVTKLPGSFATPEPPKPEFPVIERPKDLPLPATNQPVPNVAPPPPPPAPKPEPAPVIETPAPAPPAPRPTLAAVARFEGKDVFSRDTLSARGEIVYGDGTRVLLGPDTSVREETGPDGLRLSLLRGELRASVARQPAGKPFRIVSGDSTAVVLGTVLRLARRGDVTRLEVHEGRVKLDQVEVPAGRFVESTSGQLRAGRAALGLVCLYTFSEGAGRRIHDRAGTLDLHIRGATTWTPDGLRVGPGTPLIASEGPSTPIFEACRASNAFTLEAWIRPERAAPDFEGAVVGFSHDAGRRNFALIQGPSVYRVYGHDLLESPKLAAPRLTHVVFTRDARGLETLYLDGLRRMSRLRPGTFAHWDPTYRLELGDERTQERPWSGTYRLVAIYARALGPAEVNRNFSVGADGW